MPTSKNHDAGAPGDGQRQAQARDRDGYRGSGSPGAGAGVEIRRRVEGHHRAEGREELLARAGRLVVQQPLSLAISSYQTGRVYLVGSDQQGRVSFFERIFERAMGIVGNAQRIYLGGLYQLWRFENVLRPNEIIHGQFDKCYVPRNAQTIGDLDIHELGIRSNGRVVFVNTKYSCLAELSQTHSFKAIWKPDFISKLAPEDRCHLNGLAMVDGEPKYVTAVCKSDTVDGWRDRRHDGGVVIDVETDEIVCEGLSMPHSPALGQRQAVGAQCRHRPSRLGRFRRRSPSCRSAFVPGFAARPVDHRQRRRGRVCRSRATSASRACSWTRN